LVYEII
jgi:hypothetical protein